MKIHLDLDCFFVSAERIRYPVLKGKNVVVVKSSDKKIFSKTKKHGTFFGKTGAFNSFLEFPNFYGKDILNAWRDEFIDEKGIIHGIVIAKSYEAKAYGIKTGTPLNQALRMCKDLHVIPSDHLFYQGLSQKLKAFLLKKIPVLEQYSIDEFFGDLSGYVEDKDTFSFLQNLQREILQKFDLPITIGASNSKWIAKLATNKAKPFGVKIVPQDSVESFTCNVPIGEFPGIGRKLSEKLSAYKIRTLGELKNAPMLLSGKVGVDLYKRICGVDNEKVDTTSKRQAIGISRNFEAIYDRDEIYRRVVILSRYLSFTIIKLNLNPTSFYFKLRFDGGAKNSCSITKNRLFNERFLVDLSLEMFRKLDIYKHLKIHYIAISTSNFANDKNYKTLSLIDYENDKKMSKLGLHVSLMRDKYGIDIIKYANEEI